MKFNAIVHKKTGEFASFQSFNETGKIEFYTHDLPDPRPETLTLELLKGYYEQHGLISEELSKNFEDIEVKKYSFFEEDDLKEKLQPIKTMLDLLSVIKQYNEVMDHEQKENLLKMIFNFIKKSEDSIDYLLNLSQK